MSAAGALFRLAAVAALAWVIGFVLFTATTPQAAPISIATDAVVVLTGGPGRLARGVAVLDARSAKRMLVSGVDRLVTPTRLATLVEPDLPAARYAGNRKMFAQDVDVGYSAIDTRSNAEETAAWMAAHNYRSLRLVTSGWHMRRAALELRRRLPANVEIVTDAVPIEPAAASVAREYNKFVLRWIVTNTGIR